jgi:hypothetical protein
VSVSRVTEKVMHGWMGRGWRRSGATPPRQPFTRQAANVLGCLPKAVHAGARRELAEIRDAPDRDHATQAIRALVRDYGVKWPKAVAKICDDAEALRTFFDFPWLLCQAAAA